jgi:hypothetical protein
MKVLIVTQSIVGWVCRAVIILGAVLLLAGCASARNDWASANRQSNDHLMLRLTVKGLVSPIGAENLARSIKLIDGVKEVVVNMGTGEVDVFVCHCAEPITEERLKSAVQSGCATYICVTESMVR